MRHLALLATDDAGEIKPTAAMKRALRSGTHGQHLAAATKRAMEQHGLIVSKGQGRWHWTARGRAMVRRYRSKE